jgi:hypothetical protein
MSVYCWVICETRRRDALRNGYEGLVKALKRVLGELAVLEFVTLGAFEDAIDKRAASQSPGRLLIVGHRTDLVQIRGNVRRFAALEALSVLELHFTTAASAPGSRASGIAQGGEVAYCSIWELTASLTQAAPGDFVSQGRLNELIETHRAEAHKSILAPLLPLAVLADGFLVACPNDAAAWFRPGIDAALEASTLMVGSPASDKYWTQLAESRPAIERVREMIEEPANATPGFAAVMKEVRTLWPDVDGQGDRRDQAALVFQRACAAVKSAWDALTSKEGVPLDGTEMRGLVETASVGFQVLAAGCL